MRCCGMRVPVFDDGVVEASIETCSKVESSWFPLPFLCVECVVVVDDNDDDDFNAAKRGTSRGGLSSEKTTGTTRWKGAK